MPTSNHEPRRNGWGRALMRTFAVLAVFVALDAALCWVFEPYATVTELAWHDYRQTTDLDTIVVGSSFAQFGINPKALDKTLGSSTYNLGTPAQSLDNSCAAIEAAIEDHGIKRAILCVELESLPPDPWINAAISFTQAKAVGESLPQIAKDVGRLLFTEHFFTHHYSLTAIFPWAYDFVDPTFEAVSDNVRRRLTLDIHEAANEYANLSSEGHWRYQGAGYGAIITADHEMSLYGDTYGDYAGASFNEANVAALRRACALCRDAGVELYVVTPATPVSNLLVYGGCYPTRMSELKRIVEEEGATYLDFNMIRREILDLRCDAFFDCTHLNLDGATKMSELAGTLISRVEAGEDVSASFFGYDEVGWQDCMREMGFVDSVDLTYETTGDTVTLTALARTGVPERLEFMFELLDPTTDTYSVVADFSTSPTLTLPTEGAEVLGLRIHARVNPDEDHVCLAFITL